jgi:hypothetical protein
MQKKRFILILITLVALAFLTPSVHAQPRTSTLDCIQIIDAYYADLDEDSFEDDIKILVEFSLGNTDPVRINLDIWIELPSGFVYYFKVLVYRAPTESVLNIDCINMATESGWYTVSLVGSIMGSGSGKFYTIDQLTFDPPTGGGPGLPLSLSAYF